MRSFVARLSLMVVVPLVFGACAATSPSASTVPSPSATTAPAATATPAPPSISAAPSASAALKVGQIVFEDAGKDFKYSQIWIENADGSNVRRIVSDNFTDGGPVLSPDGHRVVFYRDSGDGFGRIMIVNVNGSDLHELDTGSRAKGCDAGVEGDGWSPDGRRLAFTRTCFAKAAFLGQGLWTVNADGTGLREVVQNAAPSPCTPPSYCVHVEDHRAGWSPDAKRLVFQRIDTSTDPERSALFTIRIDGKGLQQVTPWKLDANDPDWSPDGTLIAFNASAEPSPTQNIYTIRPDGTGLTQLTSGLSTYPDGGQATFHPSWSPDGTQILFSHNPSTDEHADLFVMNRDGSDLHVLAATILHENHAYWGRSPSP
jgi:Tol biopolymer transport system component